MAKLDTILNTTITWKNWTSDADLLSLLSDLQANILKGHGRDHTKNVFLSFAGMKSDAVAGLLRDLSFVTTSALTQLREAEAFKATKLGGGTVVSVFLSAKGYAALSLPDANIPADASFRAGMRNRGRLNPMPLPFAGPPINDPEKEHWEKGEAWDSAKDDPDAMVLIADEQASLVGNSYSALQKVFAKHGATVLGSDIGLAQRRKQAGGDVRGEGIEHFGYVDGISQPLFLTEDFLDNSGMPKPRGKWDEEFKASQFVVSDPGNPTTFSCGSYFVYRKLEQNVMLSKERERLLAQSVDPQNPDEDRAGAMVVGRFEDGTPALQSGPVAGAPTNDFDYTLDPVGLKCPVRAHVRKTNPRTPGDEFERSHIMARRGITYGDRAPDFSDEPDKGVGLIFMAYMADVNQQFEFTQSAWANNTSFPFQPAVPAKKGVDFIISQVANSGDPSEKEWIDGHSQPQKVGVMDFVQTVTLMGGEYFFAPSISFLQSAPSLIANPPAELS
ncbi:Dyp-type peroxidase [Neorhizobium sp. DAR64861/K0K2]|uniref:Dyp-type peroxidase n=1 Tax=Neorhizobium sp. DAR64861/K0K2 TaxID=3421956 RepID=UPI003D27C82C